LAAKGLPSGNPGNRATVLSRNHAGTTLNRWKVVELGLMVVRKGRDTASPNTANKIRVDGHVIR
jgi:hypothetical protein